MQQRTTACSALGISVPEIDVSNSTPCHALMYPSPVLAAMGVPSEPGVIVGLDGQWIRLKPGNSPLSPQRPGRPLPLNLPGPSGHLPSWPRQQVPQQVLPQWDCCASPSGQPGLPRVTTDAASQELELQWSNVLTDQVIGPEDP